MKGFFRVLAVLVLSAVAFAQSDDRAISGFLYKPPAKFAGKHPVIIDIHGGPEGQTHPDFLGRDNYYIQELGLAMIFPNVRGSTGYGKSFQKLDNGFLREGSYQDINALLDWIQTQPLDATRVITRVMITGGRKNITKPLFVIAGQNDPRVPASESAQMVEVVRRNGTPVWWLLGRDEVKA